VAHVQIKDVAIRAGVSSATVSRVLNHDPGVSEERRLRVRAAIDELGYQPNRLARNLRRNITDSVGVVISDIENPHFTRAVRVIENAAFARGYRVLLCNTDETASKQRAYLEMLAAERVLGVIVAPADPADPTLVQLLDMGIPIVAFDREIADERADAVTADNVVAGQRATEYLIRRGHTQIGFISGRSGIQTGVDREAGYHQAMEARSLRPSSLPGNFRIDDATAATHQLLADNPEITAIIVGNNLMTVGALNALRSSGRAVPGEISLVQLDDPFWAGLVSPPLTSFAQPVAEMAQAAIDLLLQRVRKERSTSRHVVYHFELRERESARSLITSDVAAGR
jgi:DNA-binding LacI/PurR family transcriptional regulator